MINILIKNIIFVICACIFFKGVFGFLMMSLLLIPFYYIKIDFPGGNNSRGVIEDFPEAITQIMNNKLILLALIGNL